MVDDVSLIWLGLDDDRVRASKLEVRDWINELGLAGATMERTSTVAAFTSACKTTRTKYVDDIGEQHEVWAHESKRKPEWITFEVVADGRPLAQLKYFTPRKTQFGLVKDSHRIMPTIKPGLLPADYEAAHKWIETALATFEETQGRAPSSAVRRVLRASMARSAVPVYRRQGVWFTYADGLDNCRAAGEFAKRCAEGTDFWIIPVAPGADPKLFGLSVDDYLAAAAREIEDDIDVWVGKAKQKLARKEALRRWRAEVARLAAEGTKHRQRLGVELPQLDAALATANLLIDSLHPASGLPSVTTG